MKDEQFNELISSIQEAGAIRRGEQKASRVFPMDVAHPKEFLEKNTATYAGAVFDPKNDPLE